jgi:hypothetical protein
MTKVRRILSIAGSALPRPPSPAFSLSACGPYAFLVVFGVHELEKPTLKDSKASRHEAWGTTSNSLVQLGAVFGQARRPDCVSAYGY